MSESGSLLLRQIKHYRDVKARQYTYDAIALLTPYLSGRGKKRRRILVCGTGIGLDSSLLHQFGEVISIDLSIEALRYGYRTKQYLKSPIQADVLHIPFRDRSFDVCVAIERIEHLRFQKNFVKEVSRVLKGGGLFLVTTPNKLYSTLFRVKWDPTHIWELLFSKLVLLMKDYFTILYGQPSGIPLLNMISEKLARSVVRFLGTSAFKVLPFAGASIWIIGVRKHV